MDCICEYAPSGGPLLPGTPCEKCRGRGILYHVLGPNNVAGESCPSCEAGVVTPCPVHGPKTTGKEQ